jgi:hypothetical protein
LLFVGRALLQRYHVLLDAARSSGATAGRRHGPMLNEWQRVPDYMACVGAWLGGGRRPAVLFPRRLFVLPATHRVAFDWCEGGNGKHSHGLRGVGAQDLVTGRQTAVSCRLVIALTGRPMSSCGRLGRAAQGRALAEFTVERMIDRVYAEYERLLS